MRNNATGSAKVREDPIVYENGKERRTLDLRPYGVACIPLLGLSNFQSIRIGTEEHVHPAEKCPDDLFREYECEDDQRS